MSGLTDIASTNIFKSLNLHRKTTATTTTIITTTIKTTIKTKNNTNLDSRSSSETNPARQVRRQDCP